MNSLRVVSPGLLTTVQDLGRSGYAAFGVPRCGALDGISARVANRLAGNADEAALLEMTVAGGRFEAGGHLAIALFGAAMPVSLNGRDTPMGETVFLEEGDRLDFGAAREGARTYLAVAGGFDAPAVLGSRSTCLASGFGGWNGRALEKGDVLPVSPAPRPIIRRLPPEAAASRGGEAAIRVLPGPQESSFSDSAVEAFYSSRFRVSPRSNRMGLRLTGSPVAPAEPSEVLPEGVVPGSIQVPADGDPIVLLADGPVTGGYPKIAVAIAADLDRLGQLRPGDFVRFTRTNLEAARGERLAREEIFGRIVEG